MHTFSPSPKSHQSTQRHLLGTIDAMEEIDAIDAMEEMEEIDAMEGIDAKAYSLVNSRIHSLIPEIASRRLTSTD